MLRKVVGLVGCLGLGGGVLANSSEPIFTSNGVSFNSHDKNYGLRLNGRFQADYVNASREDITRENNADIKRVWLTLSGHAQDWFFLHRYDIDNEDNKLSSFIEYRGFGKSAHLSFGRHKEPYGMSWTGSIKHVATPERSAISDRYTFGRSTGVMIRGQAGSLGYRFGVFEDGKNESDGEFRKEAAKIAFTGRFYSRVINQSKQLLHVGVGISERSLERAYAAEVAYMNGPFHLQSEWMSSRPESGEDISGRYFESGYFFTADSMSYKNGVFGNVNPNYESGAWQAVLRIDHGDGDYSDTKLGKSYGKAIALGLNWFANRNTRISISHTYAEVQNIDGSDLRGQELRFRTQFTF